MKCDIIHNKGRAVRERKCQQRAVFPLQPASSTGVEDFQECHPVPVVPPDNWGDSNTVDTGCICQSGQIVLGHVCLGYNVYNMCRQFSPADILACHSNRLKCPPWPHCPLSGGQLGLRDEWACYTVTVHKCHPFNWSHY